MESGQVYFWDSATDAVAWEPPAGAKPRSAQANEATFAAAQAAAPAGQEPEAASNSAAQLNTASPDRDAAEQGVGASGAATALPELGQVQVRAADCAAVVARTRL